MISMYHLVPFPKELRRDFMFPSWPYYYGEFEPPPEDTLEYFQSLGIIRYEDSEHRIAQLIPMVGGDDPLRNGKIKAFRSVGHISPDTWEVLRWSKEDFYASEDISYDSVVEEVGDDYRWVGWNVPVTIVTMNDKRVKLEKS